MTDATGLLDNEPELKALSEAISAKNRCLTTSSNLIQHMLLLIPLTVVEKDETLQRLMREQAEAFKILLK
jgi:hypothetical protein